MKKRIISALLVIVLFVCVLPLPALAAGGLSNFTKVNTYHSGQFSDIPSAKWYAPYVQAAYEYGLMNGQTSQTFAPDSNLTVAEAVKLAACLHSIYYTGKTGLSNGDPWYKTYVDYALENGILASEFPDYEANATRSEFAVILAGALPEEALAVYNKVDDGAIPDVPSDYGYSAQVYKLYRAGILTGSDAKGSFYPNQYIKRSEVSAIITRMANAGFRQKLTLTAKLTAEQIYKKCAPAVFYIEIYDAKGTAVKSGSGFFIESTGLAVTNYHVITGASAAIVTLADGTKYEVTGIYDYSKDDDIALIQVDGTEFSYLKTADPAALKTGADVYAIGSPLGLQNTISTGIVSCALREIDGLEFIQNTAAISSGSSGGALLNAAGEVVGVTTATAIDAQNINIAVPISKIANMNKTDAVTLKSLLPNIIYYQGFYPTPDFGVRNNVPVHTSTVNSMMATYTYKVSDMDGTADEAMADYSELLEQHVFSYFGYSIEENDIITYYLNEAYGLQVTYGVKTIDGVECIRIIIKSLK
jgi:hypothetical protein